MQTFLPICDFFESAIMLDHKRLGKQRVEAMQILKALDDPNNRWRNHPAVRMWKGYENALKIYYNIAVEEWKKRGYNNTMKFEYINGEVKYPHWLGREDFHDSHKSNLLRKNKEFYSQYKWKVIDSLEYIWI